MSDPFLQPGVTLKSLRASRGWSLTLAAGKTGVSKAMLGQIERGESSPTVATLWKIATGFNVPFSLFILPAEAPSAVPVLPDGLTQDNDVMKVTPLFPYDPLLRFDMLAVELVAGGISESSAHDSGVIEHVVVNEGELQLEVDGIWHTLKKDEGLRFQADCTHSYYNPGEQTVKFHSLIHYPQRQVG
ncbi:helix-turn-helix domain-containing protein [Erwinia mallotivora]|uniref:XRE family transcriptional regulator n=1 Tax=Erwinia mallotivora TaxID=69222 RepID=A0A014NL12_9GAMM|nr:XRE family transcriptional regulator [Erwinia mallotivora]EXU74480.1 XRE family transcriptional regulator [Erwinia mallotivora]